MAITIFDTREEIPETLRDKATEVEGKFHVPADALVTKHNEVLAEKKREAQERQRLQAEFDKYKDIDPERARAALRQVEDAETEKLRAQGDWDARETALKTGFETEKTQLAAQISERDAALDRFVISDELARVASDPEVQGEAELLGPFIAPLVRRKGLTDYEILDKPATDPDAKVRYGADGQPLRMKSLLLELREMPRFQRLFNAPNNGGSGAPASHAGGGGGSKRKSQFTEAEKRAFIGEHGYAKWAKLPN